jgi:hypothetical protein
MIVLGIIVLVALLGLGTCVYVGYRAKKKVDEVQRAYKSNNPKKLEEALGMGSGRSTSDGRSQFFRSVRLSAVVSRDE